MEPEKHITDEKGISYTLCGNYYLPDLALPEEEYYELGRFGRVLSIVFQVQSFEFIFIRFADCSREIRASKKSLIRFSAYSRIFFCIGE